MLISDLKEGDVLLFSPEKGSFISWAITFLTDAPVSHAAMFYSSKKQEIVEETPPHVAVNKAAMRFVGRDINVRRFKKSLPMAPVLETATSYLNNEEPYDKSGLYIVGLLLIYKKFTVESAHQKVVVKILKKVTAAIVKQIHKHQNPGKNPMVCSQFVAQCYDNSGSQYKLVFKNNVLAKWKTNSDKEVSLLSHVQRVLRENRLQHFNYHFQMI